MKKALREYRKRVVVAGSRSYNNYEDFAIVMGYILKWLGKEDFVIITGAAWEGPDRMVIKWCCENEVPWFEFPADWEQYKKRAGFIRNCEMRDACTHLIAFWDMISRGTVHMIEQCYKHEDIHSIVYMVQPDDQYYENKWLRKSQSKSRKGIQHTARENEQDILARQATNKSNHGRTHDVASTGSTAIIIP